MSKSMKERLREMEIIIGERVVKAPLKIKNEEGEILCTVYPQRRTVVLLDTKGNEHIYSVPIGAPTGLRIPSVKERK